jgi:hypothetical protein
VAAKLKVAEREFDTQRFFVYGFEQTRTQNALHLDCGPDGTVCRPIRVDAWHPPYPILGNLGLDASFR